MSSVARERATVTPLVNVQRAALSRSRLMRYVGRTAAFLIVFASAVAFVFPVYWMLITSLKSVPEFFHLPPVWWPADLRWDNYPDALSTFPFVLYATSLLVSV